MSRVTTGRVGVLMGGLSSEREVSLASGAGVLAALRELGYDCVRLEWTQDDNLAELLTTDPIDVVWNALHGTFGEDGAVQGLLACLGIPGTGAGVTASAVAMDKQVSKYLFDHHGVPTPRWCMATSIDEAKALGTPCVVKPNADGSSVGVSIVSDVGDLTAAFELAQNGTDEAVLVEEFVPGTEFTVGFVGDRILGSVEIRAADGLYDYRAKYKSGETQYLCPPSLEASVVEAAESAAKHAYDVLKLDSYGRADLRIDPMGQPYVLEVNSLPGMTKTSLLPKIAAGAGIDYPSLCEQILALALR